MASINGAQGVRFKAMLLLVIAGSALWAEAITASETAARVGCAAGGALVLAVMLYLQFRGARNDDDGGNGGGGGGSSRGPEPDGPPPITPDNDPWGDFDRVRAEWEVLPARDLSGV